MGGVRAEMLKEGGVTALEWLVRVFHICFYFVNGASGMEGRSLKSVGDASSGLLLHISS
ncbi:hypothetical protein SK128_020777 [Halocaridina rubra]|uniref:Uncharacterized protein n=1 Tax=Halocaridina rubra TaxID=373956 RepID=A0AAN8XUM2_HALRR